MVVAEVVCVDEIVDAVGDVIGEGVVEDGFVVERVEGRLGRLI